MVGTAVTAEAAIPILKDRGLTDQVKVLSYYYTPGVDQGLRRGQILAAPTNSTGDPGPHRHRPGGPHPRGQGLRSSMSARRSFVVTRTTSRTSTPARRWRRTASPRSSGSNDRASASGCRAASMTEADTDQSGRARIRTGRPAPSDRRGQQAVSRRPRSRPASTSTLRPARCTSSSARTAPANRR